MDLRNLLGKLDNITEGSMESVKKKPTGPKFTGRMKGTDPASAAKDRYVGSGMEESTLKELETEAKKEPEKRDLIKEFAEFKEARAATAAFRSGNNKRAALNAMSDEERRAYDREQQEKQRKRDDARLERERQKNGVKEDFTDLELAVMEGGHELVREDVPPTPGQQPNTQQPVPGKPTLGADVGKQQAQQAQQVQQQAKQQADAAKQAQMQQSNLQKGVNTLKSAGAAISNAGQTVQAFNKVDANSALTPGDKNNIASAGTVLAPIMANQQLAGKFKDLVTQASNDQKKQQQQAQQAQTAQTPQQPGQQPPAGTVK